MKKIIAITTAAVMACSIFAGCSTGNTASSGESSKKDESSAITSVEEVKSNEDAVKSNEAEGSQKSDSSATESTDNAGDPTNSAEEPEKTDDEKGSADELTAILTAVKDEYYPGTAGCSLVATKLAGELLDWNSACTIDDEELKNTVHEFFSALESDDAVTFEQQINAVYTAAADITGDDAESILETAGYEPEFYPWSAEDMYTLFTAVYEALGIEMPADDITTDAE